MPTSVPTKAPYAPALTATRGASPAAEARPSMVPAPSTPSAPSTSGKPIIMRTSKVPPVAIVPPTKNPVLPLVAEFGLFALLACHGGKSEVGFGVGLCALNVSLSASCTDQISSQIFHRREPSCGPSAPVPLAPERTDRDPPLLQSAASKSRWQSLVRHATVGHQPKYNRHAQLPRLSSQIQPPT